MLDSTTLDDLYELSADTLYSLEVKSLKKGRLSREEQAVYIERARRGDTEAREVLVLNCLHYAIVKAHAVYLQRRPLHVDPLDLTQEANLAMVEKIDYALKSTDPVKYLVTLAANAIQRYCSYNAPMIQRPRYYSTAELEKIDSYLAVESLDEPIAVGSQHLKVDIIEAPVLHLEADDEQNQQYRYQPLLEAVKRLPPAQRATIIRYYGLFGQPAETCSEIAESSHLHEGTVRNSSIAARRNLGRALDGVLFQMLHPKSALED